MILNNTEFQRVSRTQYNNDEAYENIQIPRMATRLSAGYDFFLPFDVTLNPGESIKIPTGIRVKIDEGWFLGLFPRSSLGFKYRCQIDNTVGIIDGDYYNSDNEGHIFVKLTNDSKDGKVMDLKTGDAFCQGVFLPYGIIAGTQPDTVRNGGLGSTNK
jgi:dUTP pyrophosphatase